jgi:hypothetical protein
VVAGDLGNVNRIRMAQPRSWSTTLASMLPLWLLSLSIMVEGFPPPPISGEVAIAAFVTTIVLSILLTWKRWMTIELLLYSLSPFRFLVAFDEISTRYKSGFIVVCAVILTSGVVGYQRGRLSRALRWPILLAAATLAFFAARHFSNSFWGMVSDLGVYERCFPDAPGCPPLAGIGAPWWALVFSL